MLMAAVACSLILTTGFAVSEVPTATEKSPEEQFEIDLQKAWNDDTMFYQLHEQVESILVENNVNYKRFMVVRENEDVLPIVVVLNCDNVVDTYSMSFLGQGAVPDGWYVEVTDDWMEEHGMFEWFRSRLESGQANADLMYYAPGCVGERPIPWTMFLSFAEIDVDISAKEIVFS